MKMKRVIAGREVGAIGLGAMSFGGIYGATNEEESFACLDAALAAGVDHWDVAEIYGNGISETVLGKYLAQSGADVSLATKGGIYREPERHFRNDEAALRRSLEGSLERLGRDRVELYYIHRRAPDLPVEAVVETMAKFVEEGLIGGIGFSEIAPATLRRAARVHPIAAVQSEYSLWVRQPEMGMLQTCAELGVTFVAFSPLARGMLSDVFPDPAKMAKSDFREGSPRFSEPNYSANRAAIEGFQGFCRDKGWTTSGAALAWVLDRGPHILPIPGTRTAGHLLEFAEGAEIVLNDADRAEIERLLPVGFAHGMRYGPGGWASIEIYG